MRAISLQAAEPGLVLAADVWVDGRLLLRAGNRLTERQIERLGELGVRTLYVHQPMEKGAGEPRRDEPAPETLPLTERTYRDARRALEGFLERARRGLVTDIGRLRAAVFAIVEDVLSNPDVLPHLERIRALEDYVFDHSIAVCAGSVFLGVHVGLSMPELRVVAMGAALHDVGHVALPEPVWLKPGQLTQSEYGLIQRHTQTGYEMIRRTGPCDLRCAHIAYQHHERWDGAGYPRGLARERIHLFARIVALVDVFEALTAPRPHRPAWDIHEAIRFVEAQSGKAFEPRLVRTFLARVAPYPVGSVVRLNTGEPAQVVRLVPGAPSRPVVRRLDGDRGEIDLSADLTRRIVGPLADVAGSGKFVS